MRRPAKTLYCAVTCFSLLLTVHASPESRAARLDSSETPRQDQVWMISTRHLGPPGWQADGNPDLQLLRYEAWEDRWADATLGGFLAEDSSEVITVVFVHGNRTEWHEAFQEGWAFYHATLAAVDPDVRLRYVMWSWPSDPVRGPLRDVRVKAERAELEAHYLAWVLAQIDPAVPVSLAAYSYGARSVIGALHLLSGGSVAGQPLPASISGQRCPMRVALFAAAVHRSWLLPTGPRSGVWPSTDQMLILYNSRDPALRWYRFIDRWADPRALGFTGLPGAGELLDSEKLTQQDVACIIGRTHSDEAYFSSPAIMHLVRQNILWREVEPGMVPLCGPAGTAAPTPRARAKK